ncbi:MAG: right-handed parallel beta-helix repeat-containing protein [Bacteroidales bacterium]|nr:right-handed parallel beta-helix repeat-containing protein [Bacteroidales bacterium]
MKTKILLANLLFNLSFILTAQIINVPDDQPTIQAGINVAMNGDTVLVEDSTYFENIKFMGKAITVASHFLIDGNEDHIDNTIIDGSQPANPDSASTVMFVNGEDTTSIICGFTIQGGAGLFNTTLGFKYGGGIACRGSGPKICHNKIKNNVITDPSFDCGGGGIGSWYEAGNWLMVVDNNVISNNMCTANAQSACGGGIYVSTNVIIRNNIIEENSCYNAGTLADGGGIEVQQFGAAITAVINNNTIQNNTVEGNESLGAGIRIMSATVTISNNEISNNSCIAEEIAYGGGIYSNQTGKTIILNNQVENNTCEATYPGGGGYYCYDINGELYIVGNMFNNNDLTGVEYWIGAGICIYKFSDIIHIADNHFKENGGNYILWSTGGALWIFNTLDKEVVIDKNIIADNYARSGAGIFTFNLYNYKIQNNVFRENYAYDNGGAIRFRQYLGNKDNLFPIQNSDQMSHNNSLNLGDTIHPLIINNVFFGNTADTVGGAIYSDHGLETPIILNSVFWENNASNGKDIYNNSENDIIVSYSDIDITEINTPWTGENNIYEDPLFVDPENGDFHIDKNSPCAGAGIDSLEINGSMFSCPSTDFENDPRPMPFTAMPDMGADEVDETIGIPEFSEDHSYISMNIFPNPFKIQTSINFNLKQLGFVKLTVVDFTGQEILHLISENLPAGTHQLEWNAEGLPTGIYFLSLKTNGISETRKLILLR